MVRLFVCAALALLIGVGAGIAAEKKAKKKRGKGVVGVVVNCDGKTLKVKSKKEEKEFTIGDDTPVRVGRGKKAEKLTVSSAKEKLVKGARVRIALDEGGKVKSIQILPERKPGKKPGKKKTKTESK